MEAPFYQNLLGPPSSLLAVYTPPEANPDHGCFLGLETVRLAYWRFASIATCIRDSVANNAHVLPWIIT